MLEGADGALSSLLNSRVTLTFMLGSDGGPEGATPNPLPATGSGREPKLLAASREGSHGALCCGGADAERERICVNDAGSDGGAAGALGALFPAPLNAPNICVREGCGVPGAGPLESARSRSSAGTLLNNSVNPPDEGAAGAAGTAGNSDEKDDAACGCAAGG